MIENALRFVLSGAEAVGRKDPELEVGGLAQVLSLSLLIVRCGMDHKTSLILIFIERKNFCIDYLPYGVMLISVNYLIRFSKK